MIQGKSFFLSAAQYIFEQEELPKPHFIAFASFNTNRNFPDVLVRDEKEFKKTDILFEEGIRLKFGHKYLDAQGRLTKTMFSHYLIFEEPKLSPIFNTEPYIDWNEEEKTENGEPFLSGMIIEKMSKSKYNVDNPDEIVDKYGADTFRMYEMFLGPVEQSKPWDTKGIEGVHRFLKKLWRLFYDDLKGKVWTEEKATDGEFKILHKTIKKIEQDTESFSYNTAVSAFMVCVNELTDLKCHKKEILEQVLILLSPYAPHISEELWHTLRNEGFVIDAAYPTLDEKYLLEATKEYPVSINGKMRTSINLPTEVSQQEAEQAVLANETVQKWLEGKSPKKFIFVKGRMINVVI
ncbi:MAG: class I tRNA ligase family protein [Arcicella sp.]|nr:class I tRNA ligase family protein [Arcicella sp.]